MGRNKQITIVSFLWHGDRWNNGHDGQQYVNTLYNMVERNLSLSFKFVLFSNLKIDRLKSGIYQRTFYPPSMKGCLPRLWMYSPMAGLEGQVLALDLDVIITGSLDEMCSYDGEFCVRSKFAPGMAHKADGDIIGFKAGTRENFWKTFASAPMWAEKQTGGRERWFYRANDSCKDRWQDLYPGQIISYKRHVKRNKGRLPEGARIVSCHGRPRPHEINEQWAKDNWR